MYNGANPDLMGKKAELMRKRMICLLLAAVMVLAMASVGFAAAPAAGLSNFKKVDTYTDGYFPDVSTGHWYYANVKASYEMGLMLGKTVNGKTVFAAADSVSIAETVVLAARIHSIYHTGSANFVQGVPWYQVYVDYAVANGIIRAGEYADYNAKATRAQFSVILAASVPESALQPINAVDAGEVYDLPAGRSYAEAAYLLYNAGIITGTDNYGTFKAGATIRRDEAVTIVTRIVDTSLRKRFEPAVYNPDLPTGMEIRDDRISYSYQKTELEIGQSTRLVAMLYPGSATSSIIWASADPSVATVNEFGIVTARGQGETEIVAQTENGLVDTFLISVPNPPAELQYELTADGNGYEIVGCDPEVYAAHIPATYNGLPVVSIKGGAFMECRKIRYYTVDPNQSVFYEEGGVIFADLPEKTLVCFPPNYDAAQYYYVPEDTVAIAPYGFAGISSFNLSTVTIPEGVLTLGDYAFAGANTFADIHVPASLVNIGSHLLQGQISNMAFYGYWNSPIGQYAQNNQIPFSGIINFDPGKQTAVEMVPQSIPATGMSNDSGLPVKVFSELDYVPYGRQINTEYDLTAYQEGFDGEIYMELSGQWASIVPGADGRTAIDMPAQTGLYGVGYTATEAVLRSYDRYGNLLATQYVNGNFAFCFPGASDLGVVGGSETTLVMIPYEPVYLASGGNYPVRADQWYTTESGSAYQFFIQQYPSGSVRQNMPNYLNVFVAGNYGYGGDDQLEAGYRIGFVELYDQSRIDALTVSLVFSGQICVADTDELVCMVNSEFAGAATFGDRALKLWRETKAAMAGDYFPADYPIQKIYVYGDGTWPSAGNNIVYMDEAIVNGADDLTFVHEFVHAADYSVPAFLEVVPGTWAEGRAEYISNKLFGNDDIYSGYDWSFLSAEDKADFFRYYYFSANRWTEYPVGTLFLMYLNDTYGEDISARITANLAALTEWDSTQRSEANAVLFKKCVEDATEVGVFQNFVRDVINK